MVDFHSDSKRSYRQCLRCQLVFVPSSEFLPIPEERGHYEQHENDPADPAYRRFLSKVFIPLVERLPEGAVGLDFGCGPGPTLSVMFSEAGFLVENYDPAFARDESVFDACYDFITTTEVVEHLHRPRFELDRLWSLLKPGGWLAIMTSPLPPPEQFAGWHYKTEPTHVMFYAIETFEWLANHWSAHFETMSKTVFLFQRVETPSKKPPSSMEDGGKL
ncbi:class I SAM-dependent methyltransferase [Thalassoroseus pseudoceratinae]|uniref:class I SAM-dependent methyltransferase n=1 Tax=Thalassoroseus pseudoceratinae TaxID=2713176 RepID=UPI001980AFD4|nr:class I SAM-dependent methyltransferase [Thalassoroseus pseudoceratinae]